MVPCSWRKGGPMTVAGDTHVESGYSVLHRYENFISGQVAALWFPSKDLQISVVIPEGATLVKRVLLEEEHDFSFSGGIST